MSYVPIIQPIYKKARTGTESSDDDEEEENIISDNNSSNSNSSTENEANIIKKYYYTKETKQALNELTLQLQMNLNTFKHNNTNYIINTTSIKPFLVLQTITTHNKDIYTNTTYNKTILQLLTKSNYIYLCEPSLITQFINSLLTIITNNINNQNTSLYPLFTTLLFKVHSYIDYILNKTNDSEQKTSLLKLKETFPIIHSNTYNEIKNTLKQNIIITNTSHIDEYTINEQGIDIFITIMNSCSHLCEQFELFPVIINKVFASLLMNPLEKYDYIYEKIGCFLLDFIVFNKYTFEISDDNDNDNELKDNYILINDGNVEDEIKSFSFMHNKSFTHTYYTNIIETFQDNYTAIVLLYIDKLLHLKRSFQIQFIIYKLLKSFITTHKDMISEGDLSIILNFIPDNLNNLSKFNLPEFWEQTKECREFAYYILSNPDNAYDTIINKITSSTSIPQYNIDECKVSLMNPIIHYGLYCKMNIESNKSKRIIIDTLNDNALIFFEVKIDNKHDIKFNMYTLNKESNDSIELFAMFDKMNSLDIDDDTIECPLKFIFHFTKRTTVYIELDNTYSWFTAKTIYYRYSLMHLISK